MTEIADDEPLEGEAPAAAAAKARPNWLVPAIIGSALFMQTLSATVISNALPTMAHALDVSPLALNLAITAYLLAAAIFLPISGWLADRYGARIVFTLAIIVFTCASAACGFAQSLDQLVLARIVQGAASAMLMPVGRLVLLRTVPKTELVGALAILTMPGLLGPMIGPPIGGFIVTFADWRWIFFLNVPVGVLGVILVTLFVPDVREEIRTPLDWKGFILTGLACAGLVFGFENLGRGALPWWALTLMLLGGAVSAWLFLEHAKRSAAPILDPTIFRYQTFSASIIGGAFLRFAIGATPFLLALLLQLGFGMTAFEAGLTTFAAAAGALAMKTTAPPLIRRFGFKPILIWNGLISAVLMFAYAFFTPQMPHVLLLAILLIGGFFRSLQFTSLNGLAYAEVPDERMSRASTLSSMGQQLAQSIGVGLAAVLLHLSLQFNHTDEISVAIISPVFAIMACITLLGLFWFVRLPDNAGAEMSGASVKAVGDKAIRQ